MLCLTSSRFTQKATLLHQGEQNTTTGHWEEKQDPISGAIVRVWVEDDPNTSNETGTQDFACLARSFISGGISGNGAVESWVKGEYENTNILRINFPKNIELTQRDRITNITDNKGNVVYKEVGGAPTIYNVDGVAPVFDPFGSVMEQTALLSRAEIQEVR